MNNTLDGNQLSKLTGITERMLRQLGTAGAIPNPEAGLWPAAKTIRSLFDFYRNRRQPDSLTDAKLKKTQLESDLLRIKKRQQEQKLIPAALVAIVWNRTMTDFRARVTAADLETKLRNELLQILTPVKVCEYFAEAKQQLEALPDEDESATDADLTPG